MDVVRSPGDAGRRGSAARDWAEGELVACLTIVRDRRGQPQPAARLVGRGDGPDPVRSRAFLTTAVSADGDGRPDIWDSSADALASAANLLAKAGWRRGESWAREVILPRGFDYGLSEGPKQPPAWWAERGARRADGGPWSAADAAAEARADPAGRRGRAGLPGLPQPLRHPHLQQLPRLCADASGLLADRIGGAGPAGCRPGRTRRRCRWTTAWRPRRRWPGWATTPARRTA